LKNAYDTLHILTSIFYNKGIKSDLKCLQHIRNELIIRKITFSEITKQIQSIVMRKISENLKDRLPENTESFDKIMDIMPVLLIKITSLSDLSDSDSKEMSVMKNRIFHRLVEDIFSQCLKRR
jgi:hypothetical protein